MHSVSRPASKPAQLVALREAGGEDFGSLDRPLDGAFHGVCGYCERQPLWRSQGVGLGALDTDLTDRHGALFTCDHFRPQRLLCNQGAEAGQCTDDPPPHRPECRIYDWENLVYACQPCNSVKGGQWPAEIDEADSYIDPCAPPGSGVDPRTVFEYHLDSGELRVRDDVTGVTRANAKRTIDDLALNEERGHYDAMARNAGIRRVRLAYLRQRHVRDLQQLLARAAALTPHLLPAIVSSVVSPAERFSSISRQQVEQAGYGRYLI